MIALSSEHGLSDWLACATALRGWAIVERGHYEQGIRQIRKGLAAIHAGGNEIARQYFLLLLAEACKEAGRLDDALGALIESVAAAETYRLRRAEDENSSLSPATRSRPRLLGSSTIATR